MRAGKVVAGVVALLVIVVVGGVIALKSIDFNQYRPLIAEEVRKATGRDLAIQGEISLEISLTPALAVADVRFANAPWGSRPEMLSVRRFEAEVALLPLLFGEVQVKRLVLEDADLLVETDSKGRGNWVFEADGAAEEAPAKAEGAPTIPVVNEVHIRRVNVTYRDGVSGETYTLALDRLEAGTQDLDGPLNVALAGRYGETPFDAEITLTSARALMKGGAAALKATFRAAGATLDARGTLAVPGGDGETDLKLSLQGQDVATLGAVAGVALPSVGPYRVAAELRLPRDEVVLSGLDVKLGESDLSGKARLTFSFPLVLEAEFYAKRLDLGPFLEGRGEAEPEKPAEASGEDGGKRVFSAEPLPLGALRELDAEVVFKGDEIVAQGLVLRDVAVTIDLKRGRLRLAPVRAALATGGRVTAEAELNAREAPARLKARIETRDLDVGKLLAALKVTEAVEGAADLDASFRGRGGSVRALMAGLDGRTNLVMGEGRIESKYVDLIAADLLAGFVPWGDETGEDARVNCLVSRFDIKGGLARSKALLFDTARITVSGEGEINLADETLDMHLAPRPKNPSLVSLAVGINVGGTLAEPRVLPDAASVIKGVAGVAAAVAIGPFGLLIPLVSGGTGEENPCVAALEGTSKAGAASGGEPPAAEKSTVDKAKEKVEEIGKSIGGAIKGLFGGGD